MKLRYLFLIHFLLLSVVACSQERLEVQNDDLKWEKFVTLFYEYKMKHVSEVPEATVDHILNDRKNPDLIIIDVRSPEERAVSFISGSITREDFENIERGKDTKIITYCTVGKRSGIYAKKLRSDGIDAYNLKGVYWHGRATAENSSTVTE